MRATAGLLSFCSSIRLERDFEHYRFVKGEKSIRVHKNQLPYSQEILDNFDFYFESVEKSAVKVGQNLEVDFSKPNDYSLKGWSYFKVHFPAFPEPIDANIQYLEFLELKHGETVYDIGAYSGISGLMFLKAMSNHGRVISVEPDPINGMNAQLNFQKYKEMFGVSPELNKCAIWSSNSELNFNSDNNIGSAVSGMNGRKSNSIKVRGITLSELGIINKISKVDAIKLDCEGAELEAFRDRQFFENNKPRIIFEAILKGERARKYKEALSILKSYGYILSIIDQIGSTQKLIGARHHKDIN